MAWPGAIDEAGMSMKKCRCPVSSVAGALAGANCQFATATSTLTFGPLTVAPSAGDVIAIDGAAPPPQAARAAARQRIIAANIAALPYRTRITFLLML